MTSLAEHDPNPPVDVADEAARTAFRIVDLGQAAWAMRKLREAQHAINEIQRVADAEILRVQEWAGQACNAPVRDRTYFEGLLTDYALRLRETGKFSLALPGGRIATRKSGGGWTVTDPDAWTDWVAERHPDLVEHIRRVPLPAAKRVLEGTEAGVVDPTTGEAAPGIVVNPEGVTASVTIEE